MARLMPLVKLQERQSMRALQQLLHLCSAIPAVTRTGVRAMETACIQMEQHPDAGVVIVRLQQ